MKLGIIGFPGSGKTSLFNAVTGNQQPVGQFDQTPGVTLGVMTVPDPRLEKLRDLYRPKKFVPAVVDCEDFTGLVSGQGKGSREMHPETLGKLRQVDAIVHVVRAFESADVPHVLDSVDPERDLTETDAELLFADLAQCEGIVGRLASRVKKATPTQAEDKRTLATLQKVHEVLEGERPVREFRPANEDERRDVEQYEFLTAKRIVVVFNVDESEAGGGERSRALLERHPGSLALCAKIEMEIAQLPGEERASFLSELGIAEPAAASLARQAYAALGAIPFFTVGEDECRAWTIRRGDTAVTAAGKIHTDLARGFIRGEVFTLEDLLAAGDEKALKAAGKVRLEGKDYVVRDGEILHVRANTR